MPWLFILLGTPDNLYRGQIINLTTGKKVEREVNIHYSVHNSVVSYESKVPHWYTIQQNNYVIKYNLDTGEEVKQISYNKESKFNLITAVGNCLAVADKNASIYIVAKKTRSGVALNMCFSLILCFYVICHKTQKTWLKAWSI